MNLPQKLHRHPGTMLRGIVALASLVAVCAACAEPRRATPAGDETVSALLLSDIHFEPFFDPGKVPQLAAAPVADWKKILAAPPSADRDKRFADLESSCKVRGEDTSYPLLNSSLQAMRVNAQNVRFATVSGDLIAHAFQCKFAAIFPHAAPGDYRAFVERTLDFVIGELATAVPGAPLYVALGNNDSDCGDYKLDPHSDFLEAAGEQVARSLPPSGRGAAEETFAAGGYYSAPLPAPIRNARLIVLDDQFMSSRYQTCAGKPDTTAADAQIAWLQLQLEQARQNHQKVWVMAHIPPGIDVHASVTQMNNVCGTKSPKMFLASEKISSVLVDYSDVVQLAIFAHTHMDEVRILRAGDGPAAGADKKIAVKLVSSISPINGNPPTFTVAQVDAASATLKDFKVFAASNMTGLDTTWHEEYDWGKTYHEADFSAASVNREVAVFAADPEAKTSESRDYIINFYAGASPLLGLVWPQYACSLFNDTAQAYNACVCPAGK